jgi:hypothetical protein
LEAEQLLLLVMDADHWKTWVHQRLATPMGSPGAMTLFKTAQPQNHLSLAKHLTAEVKIEELVAGKGTVVKWERPRRQNHRFDALYNACAAATRAAWSWWSWWRRTFPRPSRRGGRSPTRSPGTRRTTWYRVRERDRWR